MSEPHTVLDFVLPTEDALRLYKKADGLAVNLNALENIDSRRRDRSRRASVPATPGSNALVRFLLVVGMMTAIVSSVRTAEFQDPEDIAFTAAVDGSTQRYVQMLPKPVAKHGPEIAMICLHGHGSDRWQYVKDARGECAGAREVAGRYGMLFLSPDYRATTSWMGPAAEADLVQIITELRAKRGVKKIFLTGASMGGTSALIFTALHSEVIDGVCSENGMANMIEYEKFSDAIAASYGGSKAERAGEYRRRSAEFFPDRFTMPLAITVGGKDATVPPQSVLRLGAVLTKAERPVLVINREDVGHETSYDDTVLALEFVVKKASAISKTKNSRR